MKTRLSHFLFIGAALALGVGGAPAGARQQQQTAAPKKEASKTSAAKPSPEKPKVTEIKEAGLKSLLEASAAKNRPLLVNFWATWCTPCREEFPDLVALRGLYADDALDFVTVSLDDPSDIDTTVPAFLAEMRAHRMPAYLLNADDQDAAITLVDQEWLGADGKQPDKRWQGELPATYLFDRAGKVAFKHMGRIKPAELRAAVEKVLAGTQSPPASAFAGDAARPAQLLAYDASVPLDIKTVGAEREGGVSVEDITFQGLGETIAAYVVRPTEGAGPFAGVLFVHWFAPPDPTSNRTQYLDEAKALARRGTVSLLVSTFWSDEARYRARRWETDYQNSITQAKNLRRALDVLLSRPGVDARRVGLVGHDYGAMFGALVAAADARPKACVLVAGTSRFADWYLFGSASGVPRGEALARYREQLAAIDPVSVVGASKAAFFFQFGEDDRYTPRDNFVAFYLAAPAPKRIATYASDHDMKAAIIRHDRLAWVAEQLGLPAAP